MTRLNMSNKLIAGMAGAQVGTGLIGSIGNLVLGAQQLDLMSKQIDVQKQQIQLAYDQPLIDAESQRLQIQSKYDALIGLGVDQQGAFEAIRGGRYMSGGRSITPMSNVVYSHGGGVYNNNATFMPTINKNSGNTTTSTNIPAYRTHQIPEFRNPPPTVVQAWSDTSSVRSLDWDYTDVMTRRASSVSNLSMNSNATVTTRISTPSFDGAGYELPVWSGSIKIRQPGYVAHNYRDSFV